MPPPMRINLMFVGIRNKRKRKKRKSCIHVVVDFVSPESLFESENLFEGRRSLPSDNFQKEYKLKIQDFSSRVEGIYDMSAHVRNVLLPILKKHVVEAETQDDKALQMIVRAEAIVRLYESTDGRGFETTCSCRTSDAQSGHSLKATSREDGKENYLYCLVAADTEKSDLRHFQTHLSNGEPVIVCDVLSGWSGFSWEPTVMERAISYLQKASDSMDLTVTNCSRFCESCIHVAIDFVSPESLSESENLFEGCRSLCSDNFQKEYKLKMRKLLRDMVTHAVENWEKIPGVLMSEETCSLGLMKQITKMMKLLLERDGHKVPPAGRNKLEDEIQKFLNLFPTSSKSRVS